jgi:hypothetical protein
MRLSISFSRPRRSSAWASCNLIDAKANESRFLSRVNAAIARQPSKLAGAKPPLASVVTRMRFAAPPGKVWEGLMFYEQIEELPPLLLRLLLPVPLRTEGRKSEVGDQIICRYVSGHLRKQVTHVTTERDYTFEVIEQNLSLGGGIRLAGGSYTLYALPEGGTEVVLETRYLSPRRPRWLCAPIEAAVCRLFHRHILRTMRRRLAAE